MFKLSRDKKKKKKKTISDAFTGRPRVIEKGIICYDFATPTKLSHSLFISVVPWEDVVLKWEILKRHDSQLQICGFPLFMNLSIFKTIEIPSYLKNKGVKSES